ncbi:EF-hand domain-containing protein, partial [Acinetobacter baumannii]|nr:EF-hand domain-containing protein [Acinetobacter baumannii]
MGKAASKLSNEDLNELKKATKFQTKELKQWYNGFKRDCPSGKLTRDEFIRIHKQFFPFGDPTDCSNYAFDAFDKDKRDAIDFKEFIIALSIASRGTKEEKLRWTFNMYDLDRDGIISYDEM